MTTTRGPKVARVLQQQPRSTAPGPRAPASAPPRPDLLPAKMVGAAQPKLATRAPGAPGPARWPAAMPPPVAPPRARGTTPRPVSRLAAQLAAAAPAAGAADPKDEKKPKKPKISNDQIFNDLLHVLGTDALLVEFARNLGRAGCVVKIRDGGARKPAAGFEGLFFDGAHWKGYDADGTTYDSYQMKLQIGGTNNYCQSFACYLWAKHGVLGDGLAENKYVDNIQGMSALWLDFFKTAMASPAWRKWLVATAGGPDAVTSSIVTLTRLTKEAGLASELSQSKQ